MVQEIKRLTRSRSDRMFAGVCGGIGEYFDIDVTLVRLIFVGLFFLGFPGILLVYLIMMVLVPQEPISDPVLPA